MRILRVGAGGVGSAVVPIAARREFFESMVVADYDRSRAERAVAQVDDPRFVADQVDASNAESVAELVRAHRATHVLDAVDPRFVLPIFNGTFAAGADYLDMAMSLSFPHPTAPYQQTGVKLGDEQFAVASEWESAGRLALVGVGIEPRLLTSSPGMPRTSCSARSMRPVFARGRTSRSTDSRSHRRSRSGPRSRSA
jgi:saccharopine dehydrogenase (NAD+, L-lysine-forming)